MTQALKERDDLAHARANAKSWFESIEEMIGSLNATDRTDLEGSSEWDRKREAAQQTIEESALSVMVRDGWHQPGQTCEDGPDEYEILLSTGGPALRLYGKLNKYSEPETCEMQMQDWGTLWTRYPAPEDTLLQFASRFYFGE